MHVFTHVPQEYLDRAKQYTSGADVHCAGMLQHDEHIGLVLKKLDDLGIADDTVVIYSTDNGPEHSTWPHGSTTPYRSEKMTTWEGGIRVPMMVRWPGHIPSGRELNGIHCGEDVFATLAAIAGAPDIKERLAKGDKLGSSELTYKCHIDGLNQLNYWTGATDKSARNIFYYYAESKLQAVRWNQWKIHFVTRSGYYGVQTELEIPWFFNIRQDPFESYDQAPGPRALISQEHSGIGNIVLTLVGEHLATFKEFPPRQKATSLNIDKLMDQMNQSTSTK
jgi:arylsulfatase A-like enzyme